MMLEKRLLEAQSTLKKRIRELVIPLFIFILTACGVLIYGIHQSAGTLDRVEVKHSEKLLTALMADHKKNMKSLAVDYSYWEDAIDNLVLSLDVDWADDNIGYYLYELHGLGGSDVIDTENQKKYANQLRGLVTRNFVY